jgi:hypothetical protein
LGWHPRYFTWTVFQNTRFDPYENVWLWENGEGLTGFAILEEPDSAVVQVRPRLRGVLEEPMLRWAAERLADPARNPGAGIRTRALDTDRRFITLLDRLGFHRDDDHAVKMHRRLDIPIPGTMSSVRAKARPTSKVGVWVSARASTSPSWTRAERIGESPWHLRPSARMSAPGCTPSSSGWFRVIPEVVDEAATRERRAPSSRL